MSDNIKVVVKVRPLISREIEAKLSYQWRVNNNTISQVDSIGHCFTFDKVYDKDTKTCDVYNDIAKPIVEAALAGFNGTIFAYGQTSSGKTYTMTGTEDAPGIIPLAVLNLFDRIKDIPDREFLVRVSYVEIYNETLIDLLDIKKSIKISETYDGVKVDATERLTTSPEEILKVMEEGKVNRQTGATNMNEESSRSHSIFQITIESREHIEGGQEAGSVNVSQLNLVDLAGSERSGQTGATGIRFKEGTHINKSLSALALVIKQLSEDPNKHVNYRDSKLTRILQNSLGGNAKTSIICAVTPATVEETISTLQFASRAKAIKNSPAVNVVTTDASMIQDLTKELSSLKTELESKKSVEQDNHNLQNKIARLQSLILNGFVRRSNADILCGARRKLNPPRRVTISTLHPIEEDPVPAIPKFCTPSLKYNPMTLPSASEFIPIQKTASLSCVTEEPRLVTPPPRDKKVNFDDEVIEIDSDDDNSSNIQPCSPYHKCFDSSKTPPCILRKNAKLAEKNLKDIVELTEREKLFTPNVVELMESLENKISIIAKLEEDVNKLTTMSTEKDVELEKLRSNINRVEKEISSITTEKENLEDHIKDYKTKLTDSEVSYESLKKKARMREEELLSLLREFSSKKTYENTGINTSIDFENETNISNVKEKENILANIQAQLVIKDQTILELQERLSEQSDTINILKNTNKEFEEMLEIHKNNIALMDNEKSSHIATIESLNAVIEEQKSLIDSINTDNESYISVIQELQTKLSEKESMLKELIIDVDIDDVLVNKEILIANNDNLKNIINSLKINIQNKKEEINKIKSELEQSCLTQNIGIQEELDNSRKQIKRLTEEIENLKTKYNENNSDNLIATDLTRKLSKIEEEKNTLQNQNEAYQIEISKLKECNDLLNIKIAGRELDTEHLKQQHEIMNTKIMSLEGDIENKIVQIVYLEEQNKNTQIHMEKIKVFIKRLQDITSLVSGNMKDVPEIMDDMVVAFTTFNDDLDSLEIAVTELLTQRRDMLTLIGNHESEIDNLQQIITDCNKNINDFCCECETILEINKYVENSDKENQLYLNNEINNGCDKLKHNLNSLIDLIKTTKTQLSLQLEAKSGEINELLCANTTKDSKLEEVLTLVTNLKEEVKNRDQLLNSILEKCSDLTSGLDIENSISCEFDTGHENTFEKIILTFEKISNYINILKATNVDESDNIKDTIADAKKEILHLTEENLKLINDISTLEKDKSSLSSKLKEIHIKNKDFVTDLRKSKNLLDSLKCDVESNVREFKYGFNNLNEALKEHMYRTESEKSDLLYELTNLKSQTDLSPPRLNINNNFNQDIKNDMNLHTQLHSPPSLLTICCNTIIEAIEPDSHEKSLCESSSLDSTALENVCQCEQLLSELESLKKDNCHLKNRNDLLQSQNEDLIKEQEIVQKEVRSLIESSHELQKKVVNHRTNLSTLMATTYAENKSLTSQIKFLQHYYSRFYNVCQKDIPDFKKQLQDLLVILRSENLNTHNESFKRYSLPNALDSTSIHSTFKNESILDGDLLMLDTNVSLATCDNTLLGPDQTGLETTQIYLCKEVACQTSNIETDLSNMLHPQAELETSTQKIYETLQSLKDENEKLRELVHECSNNKTSNNSADFKYSPEKIQCIGSNSQECKHAEQLIAVKKEYDDKYTTLSEKLIEMESQKLDIELKYNKLNLDVTNVDALSRKLNAFEKEIQTKQNNIDKLTSSLNHIKKIMEKLQEENDDLSNQVMDYVSEIDSLKDEHERLKSVKTDLANKCNKLEEDIEFLRSSEISDKHLMCSECKVKDHVISDLRDRLTTDTCTRMNRSYSDSESSSNYNKLCTLQSELHAGKEDCIELKENVTTIKNHLEGSPNHQPMDLDISMGEPHVFALNEDLTGIDKANSKNDVSDNSKECQLSNYNLERTNCFNYYIEKIGGIDSISDSNVKIIDIMKMLYENLLLKHNNDVENLRNRLKVFEGDKQMLENQVTTLTLEKDNIIKDLKEKDGYLKAMADVILSLKNNLNMIKDTNNKSDIARNFREKFLHKIDSEFGLDGTIIFETLIDFINNVHKQEIQNKEQENLALLEEAENIKKELSVLKSTHLQKENDYNTLCQQKEKIHEINNSITLDIIQKDRELRDIAKSVYKEVSQLNVLKDKELDFNLPLNEVIKLLFELTFSYYKEKNNLEKLNQDKNNLIEELNKAKDLLSEKEKELLLLKEQNDQIQSENERNLLLVSDLRNQLQQEIDSHNDLKETYEKKLEENTSNMITAEKLTETVNKLKEDISNKELLIKDLESKLECQNKQNNFESKTKLSEVLQSLAEAHKNNEELKSINEKITQEKEALHKELEEAGKIITQNKIDLEKVNADIVILKESLKENGAIVEKLQSETKILLQEKTDLQSKLQEKSNECLQLQVNIKTHEKTAEVQSKMIIKTRKQKDDAELASREKDVKLEELNAKCKDLQDECNKLSKDLKIAKEDINSLKSTKDLLEARVSELEAELEDKKGRQSVCSVADSFRRRRQSIHDSKRLCNDLEDEKKLEAMFKSHTPTEDMFMDVDNCSSNRSTPLRSSRGRDSISSRHDHSEREEEHGALGSARSRRRSTHDLRRSLPNDNHIQNNSHDSSGNTSINSELQQLKKRFAACEEELMELKERYKELDDECETCAEYLRQREEQCKKLKKEKAQLETMVEELNTKLKARPLEKPNVADAHVNTDEDWTNLHSVIVDRMSYDAEVEKNKKLMKTIEELRFNKQHLKTTIDKMQKALEKNSSRDRKELEATKCDLESCKQELAEYKERCRELDEECETCAEYLRERDEQCRKLKEAKAALETKLQEYCDATEATQSARKKRHTLHDRRRTDADTHTDTHADTHTDAATDTCDFSSYQVEKDSVSQSTTNASHIKDYDRLKSVVQRLSAQKAELEQQLQVFSSSPVFVATGSAIVQNQQITDIMKENQKLKKINAKLISMCKKRGKTADSNRENEDPSEIIS